VDHTLCQCTILALATTRLPCLARWRHIAAGRPCHGRKVQQGAVVYIALERFKVVERRAIAFRQYHDLNNIPFALRGGVYDLRQPKVVASLIDIVREIEAELKQSAVLIVIETDRRRPRRRWLR